MKNQTGILSHGGNHYAMVNGFVYTLHAFGREDQAEMFATTLSKNPVFTPDRGWRHFSTYIKN